MAGLVKYGAGQGELKLKSLILYGVFSLDLLYRNRN